MKMLYSFFVVSNIFQYSTWFSRYFVSFTVGKDWYSVLFVTKVRICFHWVLVLGILYVLYVTTILQIILIKTNVKKRSIINAKIIIISCTMTLLWKFRSNTIIDFSNHLEWRLLHIFKIVYQVRSQYKSMANYDENLTKFM